MEDLNLVVVSNRLPFVLKVKEDGSIEQKFSAGGLVTAVAPVVVETKGIWVGWPGSFLSEPVEIPPAPNGKLQPDQIVMVTLDKKEHDLFYNGLCNSTLWPLFHSMPDRAIFDQSSWVTYEAVNEKFAHHTIEKLKSKQTASSGNTVIWIHDYHLMLACKSIKKYADESSKNFVISFFLHIPFPCWDIFKILPWKREILEGLLSCHHLGFHISDYCLNFLDCCERGLGYPVDRERLTVQAGDGHLVFLKALPISIPYKHFETMALEAPLSDVAQESRIILGVDRLDYTKGIPNRLRAMQRLLLDHPEHQGQVVLLQIATPSRTDVGEYQDLKKEMDALVGAINRRFSTPKWSPIQYIYDNLPHQTLAGLYRDAEVALVTPLRDGMNLVAKEFVACQVNKPGVIILSPFAGVGNQMQEALVVNPYEIGTVSKMLHQALVMPQEERARRMKALQERERRQDVHAWMRKFLKALESVKAQLIVAGIPPELENKLNAALSQMLATRNKVALLLDFDGTLAALEQRPEQSELPQETRLLLEKLVQHPNIVIAIVSGRNLDDLRSKVDIEGLTYAGNHGQVIQHRDGSKTDLSLTDDPFKRTKLSFLIERLNREVINIYDYSWIEYKGATVCVHYRLCSPNDQQQVRKLATEIIEEFGLIPVQAHMAVDSKLAGSADKGTAVNCILQHEFGREWATNVLAIYAGDDTTDEDAMEFLKGKGVSFRVENDNPRPQTFADVKLDNIRDVFHLLQLIHNRKFELKQ